MVTAVFEDRESAERAYKEALRREGYSKEDVNVLMADRTHDKHFTTDIEVERGSKAMKGAGVGSAVGGVGGALAGALAAVGSSIAVPGLGLVIAGPLAAALAGAGAGGAAGGILGALVGAGIPEERAKRYKRDLKEGGIVLGVIPRSDEDVQYFERTWRAHHGSGIYPASTTGEPASTTGEAEGTWSQFKGRLREIYPDLTDDEIGRYKGQRERLEGYIQEETGQPHSTVTENIDRAARDAGYTFQRGTSTEAAPSRPAEQRTRDPWRAFKANLSEMYGSLTGDEIERYKGSREKLEGHIQKTTGQPYDTVRENIDRAARDANYTFGSRTSGRSEGV